MSRAVFYSRTNIHPTGRGYHPGDCVQVFDDGVELGSQVEPETAPPDTPFIVIEIPGVSKLDLIYLMAEHRTPLRIQNDPNQQDFGEEVRDTIARRRYRMDVSKLPAVAQNQWAETKARTRRSPISLANKTILELAIFDKLTGAPINPAEVPRGKKEHPQVSP